MKVSNKTFKVHLDGYNITDALAGKSPSPREGGMSASLRRRLHRRVGSHMLSQLIAKLTAEEQKGR
jgi:hypothetical protein